MSSTIDPTPIFSTDNSIIAAPTGPAGQSCTTPFDGYSIVAPSGEHQVAVGPLSDSNILDIVKDCCSSDYEIYQSGCSVACNTSGGDDLRGTVICLRSGFSSGGVMYDLNCPECEFRSTSTSATSTSHISASGATQSGAASSTGSTSISTSTSSGVATTPTSNGAHKTLGRRNDNIGLVGILTGGMLLMSFVLGAISV